MIGATLIRPLDVAIAQLIASWLCLFRRTRILTYSEGCYLGPLPLKVHYLQIELEDGLVLYRSPELSSSELEAKVSVLRDGLKLSTAKLFKEDHV